MIDGITKVGPAQAARTVAAADRLEEESDKTKAGR